MLELGRNMKTFYSEDILSQGNCTHKSLSTFYWVCYIMYTNLTSLCHIHVY